MVAAELVETSRLWARTVARIEPEWAEHLAPHLVRRAYSEPRWDAARGSAVATEKVTLYGLPIVAARRIQLGRVDPELARELFIRHALVEGDWQSHHRFLARNRQVIEETRELEKKARRRGFAVDDEAVFQFYEDRIPAEVLSARHFDAWWKRARGGAPHLLDLTSADLTGPDGAGIDAGDYPSSWGGLPVSYEFAPGEADDGVAVEIPLASLNQVRAEDFTWQVPGLRLELITELIRALPKQLRTALVPAPDVARAALERIGRPGGPGGADGPAGAGGDVLDAVGAAVADLRGVRVPREAWDLSRLPPHLRVTFRITDGGQTLAAGKDLAELRRDLAPRLRATLAGAARDLARTGLRSWDFGALPEVFERGQVRAYPALADAGEAADIRLFETRAEADASMRRGVIRLLLIEVPSGTRAVAGRLPSAAKLALSRSPYPGAGALLDDCAAAAAGGLLDGAGGPPRDAEGFAALLELARLRLRAATTDVIAAAVRVMTAAHQAEAGLDGVRGQAFAAAAADMREQLTGLIAPGFISRAGAGRLDDIGRYLRGISYRLERGAQDVRRDTERMAVVHRVSAELRRTLAGQDPQRRAEAAVAAEAIRWQIEELRISLFAVALGASGPVSEQRVMAALGAVRQPGHG